MKLNLFSKKIGIEEKIDGFLNKVSEAGLIFQSAMEDYFNGNDEVFAEKREALHRTENEGDTLRRDIERHLYTKTLIPESRGDVLELIENMDALLDYYKAAIWRFDIEKPEICREFHSDFRELVACGVKAVEETVCSCRAFFKNIDDASNHMHKVTYWEKQADVVSTRLQRAIFSRQDLRLSHRQQIRNFARFMEKISDEAEDVIDRLSIYIIKRAL
ncbi:MAG: DUF47 family protein [Deltaproteobacteria bacterium]|nr:DUF47 family protein [Deltaproteobacteria bacterium]